MAANWIILSPGVYPRSRRGTLHAALAARLLQGLSPLAQGNPLEAMETNQYTESIPARAGEPNQQVTCADARWVYPRSRRGTWAAEVVTVVVVGLSPLAQGNRPNSPPHCEQNGSIPARAGEPIAFSPAKGSRWVYPRSRRGTHLLPRSINLSSGLSPLAQGNLQGTPAAWLKMRSIPARAGEPQALRLSSSRVGVYPRSRRGTSQQCLH